MSKIYYTIGEVSEKIDVKPHTIRYWEERIPQVKPQKILNGIRHYKQNEIEKLYQTKILIYEKKYTIDGVKLYFDQEDQEDKKIEKVKKELKEVLAILN